MRPEVSKQQNSHLAAQDVIMDRSEFHFARHPQDETKKEVLSYGWAFGSSQIFVHWLGFPVSPKPTTAFLISNSLFTLNLETP